MLKTFGYSIVIISFFLPTLIKADQSPNVRISIVHSYHKNYQLTTSQEEAFTQTITKLLPNTHIKYSIIHLDTKWIEPTIEYRKKFLLYWKFKNEQYLPDYIYVTDDNALNFLLEADGSAPFSVPLVYSGINDLNVAQRIDKKSVVGITQKKSIDKTLELVEQLSTKYQNILFIGDGGVTDSTIEKEIYKQAKRFPKLNITKVQSDDKASITAQVNAISPDLIIITTLGKVKNENDVLISIKDISAFIASFQLPVLAMDSAYLQKNILGGAINSNQYQGTQAAFLMSELIKGKSILDIKPSQDQTQVIVDSTVATAFQLSLKGEYFKQVQLINVPKAFYNKAAFITKTLQFFVILLSLLLLLIIFFHLRARSVMKSRLLDKLSGLKNRTALSEQINAQPKHQTTNLAKIDILDFRSINDFYGLDVGDLVIREVANTIVELSTQCDVYRISGDVFAIHASKKTQPDIFTVLIQQLIQALERKTLIINDHEINLKFVAGISLNENDNPIAKADIALQKVKETFDDIYIYDNSLESSVDREVNIAIANTLKTALKNNQLVPFLQPIVCNKSKQTVKYEALARIVTSDRVISPFEFLPIAKITKQYIKLTESMLTKTVQTIIKYDVAISVNISIEDICSESIINHFKSLIQNRAVAEKIGIEIVESEQIDNHAQVEDFINEFKALGCHVLIDDFGTGYSNFSHILTINADIIKIDGSIIRGIMHDKNSIIIVKTIVGLAKSLNMKTAAEFVESAEIFEKVTSLGVDYSQGYYFGKPESIEAIFKQTD